MLQNLQHAFMPSLHERYQECSQQGLSLQGAALQFNLQLSGKSRTHTNTVLSISVLRKKSIEARLLATCIWAQIALSTIIAAIRAINAVPMGAILAMVSQQLKSVRHFTIAPSLSPIAASLSPGFIVGETAASKNLRRGRIRVTYARSALRIFSNAPNFRAPQSRPSCARRVGIAHSVCQEVRRYRLPPVKETR